MLDKTFKVSQYPPGISEALKEAGFADDDTISIVEAAGNWTSWELGDEYWGTAIADMIDQMAAK